MARYRITHWKGIPSLVEAVDGDRTVRRPLSARFQEFIDTVAMRDGASATEAYLEGWEQGPERDRPGGAEAVAEAVAAELEAGFDDLVAARLGAPDARA
jgi:hypothetical protein